MNTVTQKDKDLLRLARAGAVADVEQMLAWGSDANWIDSDGDTALRIATAVGKKLDKGTDRQNPSLTETLPNVACWLQNSRNRAYRPSRLLLSADFRPETNPPGCQDQE